MSRIFVSSTFEDLEECRKKVSHVLRQMGHEDVAMENFVAEDKWPLDKCLEEVASSDLYIGIFAWRYGYIPDGYDKSMTELEYRKSIDSGKSRLIFLLHEDAPWPRKHMDKDEKAIKLENLRQDLLKKRQVSFFQSADDLASKVGAAVHNWEKKTGKSVKKNRKITELDLNQYREVISKRYCNIDLDALTPSKKEDYLKIKLSSVFVEQNVRENPPPVELPKEIWNKMHEEWDPKKECIPVGLTADDLKRAKESYYSKDPKAVLDVISEERNKYIVILGDPGSGKSTLTKYILLSVLQIKNDEKLSLAFNSYLPLRVELREFAGLCAEKECKTFLDYFEHLAETEGYSLTKVDVDNYLKNNGKAIVIFDGLDEIFDPKEWERINHMIVGFRLDYPKVRIIVTSRIVGYKRKILEDADFVHFTLQDFEKEQIDTFLERWYPFVVDEKEIENRKSRIIKALKDSPSVRQLAGNPLLLTIMAIIGKHQELPRERWKLYDHAASVLVENWEVNKHLKRSSVDMDFIGEDDKKELLMKIAFKMQSSTKGLAGNFIHRKTLQQEIEIYLQNRYQKNSSDTKMIAESIIDQLRRVNFILCLYGADFYGFVHRTFLEYFCALDIVQKFDNRELDPETLKSDYFEKYWEDPTWHEVLSLICGMKEKFAGEIIDFLMQAYSPQYFGNRPPLNISLAIKCLSELRNPNAVEETSKKLLERILKLFEMVRWTQDINQFLAEEIVPAAKLVGDRWPHQETIIDQFSRSQIYMRYYSFLSSPSIDLNLNNTWTEFILGVNFNFKKLYQEALRKTNNREYSSLLGILILGKCKQKDEDLFYLFLNLSTKSRLYFLRSTAVQGLVRHWHDEPETLNIVKQLATTDEEEYVRNIAVELLSLNWHDSPETLNIVKQLAMNDEDCDVRNAAVEQLARGWYYDPETLIFIKQLAKNDEDGYVRSTVVEELARSWHDFPETFKFIKQMAVNDKDGYVRSTVIEELANRWLDFPETFKIIKQLAMNDKDGYVRSTAVQELANRWHDDTETFKFIKQLAMNDEEGYVKSAAIRELTRSWHDDPETLIYIKRIVVSNEDWYVRDTAIKELARNWHDDPETLIFIKQLAANDKDEYVRGTAVQELARSWHDDPETLKFIKQLAMNDEDGNIRRNAVEELTRGWHDDSETLIFIKQLAMNDKNEYVRSTIIKELARCWHDDPETPIFIKQLAANDKDEYVRGTAVQELARSWHDDPETLNIVKQLATVHEKVYIGNAAVQELTRGWHDDPETLNIVKQLALTDKEESSKGTAIKELARGWHDDPETLNIIKRLIMFDKNNEVRKIAIDELACGWYSDPETLTLIKQLAMNDEDGYIRLAAIKELARIWRNDSETLEFLKNKAATDGKGFVRRTSIKKLARGWNDNPKVSKFIKQLAMTDKKGYVRLTAIKELARGWNDDLDILKFIKQRAKKDEKGYVRRTAVKEFARWCTEDQEVLKFIKQRASIDDDYIVRRAAVQELARCWQEDTEIHKFIKQRAVNDENYIVKKTAVQELKKRWEDLVE